MDKFILDTHTQHTSLMFNEYLFHLCDCPYLNVMCVCSIAWWSNLKWFLSILFVSRSDFLSLWFWKFFSKCQILCVEKLCLAISWLLSWVDPSREIFKKFQFLKISGREFCGSLVNASRCSPNPRKSTLCIYTFRE